MHSFVALTRKWLVETCVCVAVLLAHAPHAQAGTPQELAVANDNRSPAGTQRGGITELHLVAGLASWRPDAGVDSTVTVLAFAEEGGAFTIPGPLLRVPQGTEVRVFIRNSIRDSVRIGMPAVGLRREGMRTMAGPGLIVHGLRAGTVDHDTVHVAPGRAREVRYRASVPGTYLYWGSTSQRTVDLRTGRDAQLTGAIVVDPAGVPPDPDERIFVITMLDVLPDSTRPPPYEDIFELAINGLAWPYTERLHYEVGSTVRWRWVNGSFSEHPMHLHGFHFRTLARGNGSNDTSYSADAVPLAVTELVEPGATFRMEWVPTTQGNWLMHCHLRDHIIPFPERDDETVAPQMHDLARHPLTAMAGLVLGITVTDPSGTMREQPPDRRLRLLAQQRLVRDSAAVVRGFVLQNGAEPPRDSVVVPGPPLLLTRGETTAITVVNRISEPTTVHWHGMELESVYDGVAGWSRTGSSLAPLIAPGDSFIVQITPPRAGTFIYHTHKDETEQLSTGMYGPLLVLDPGETFEPEVDHVFVIGGAVDGDYDGLSINGRQEPAPVVLRAGTQHRLRIINISPDATVNVALVDDSGPLRWQSVANDGADLPPSLRVEGPARVRLSTGETYDFAWTPSASDNATLLVQWPFPTEPGELILRQPVQIR